MDIFLIRHGMTPGNREHRYIGRTDEPLSEEGRAALLPPAWADQVTAVCVSPMLRARQTAAILFPHARQIPVEGLHEMDFGQFEGKNFAQLEHDPAYRAWVEGGCVAAPPGGEDMETLNRRCCAAFAPLVAQALAEGKPRLVVVAHGGTLMALLAEYARPRQDYFSGMTKNGCGWHLTADAWPEGGLTLVEPICCVHGQVPGSRA